MLLQRVNPNSNGLFAFFDDDKRFSVKSKSTQHDEDLGIYYGVFSSIYGFVWIILTPADYVSKLHESDVFPFDNIYAIRHIQILWLKISPKLGMSVISFKSQQQALKLLPFGFMAFSDSSLTGLDCRPRFFASQANLFWNLKTLFIKVDSWRYWTHVWESIESPFLWPSQTQIGSGCQFLCKSSVLLQKWRGLVSR